MAGFEALCIDAIFVEMNVWRGEELRDLADAAVSHSGGLPATRSERRAKLSLLQLCKRSFLMCSLTGLTAYVREQRRSESH